MQPSRLLVRIAVLALLPAALAREVRIQRVPESGLQPAALVDATGRLHLIYLVGDPGSADVRYVTRARPDAPFSTPERVSSAPGSAIAVGSVRGPRLALGGKGRVHVTWNGSSRAPEKDAHGEPLLYTRRNDAGDGFEPQRNLRGETMHLDGGADVATDGHNRVFVVWHAAMAGDPAPGETNRAVFAVQSDDAGRTFSAPRRVDAGLGVCACCGLKAAARDNHLWVMYRTAANGGEERGFVLLETSGTAAATTRRLDSWTLNQCPMSTAALSPDAEGLLAAWETRGQLSFTRRTNSRATPAIRRLGTRGAKHPVVTTNSRGETLVAWTEGTGWQRGGSVAWQLFNREGEPSAPVEHRDGVPVWGTVAVSAEADASFSLFY